MRTKDRFKRAYRLDEKIDSDIRELEQVRSMLFNVSEAYGAERVQTSMKGDKIPNCIARIEELEQLIDREIDAFVDLKAQIRSEIESLDNPDENILMRYRYIEMMSWNDIQTKMGFEDGVEGKEQMFKVHGRALKKLDRAYNSRQ